MSADTAEEGVERITPRVLVRIELSETPARKPQTRYEAQTPEGTIHGGNNYSKDIIGFAEFPANTRLSPREEFGDFREQIELNAKYVHWKSEFDQGGDAE